MLAVNTASYCGNTPQYTGLEALHDQYGERGLVVVGFPCNQFGGQEPGTEAEILEFCTTTYDVSFPMLAKIDVKGENAHPLFKHLTRTGDFAGEVQWNFTKFLLNEQGEVVARFEPQVQPQAGQVTEAIEALL